MNDRKEEVQVKQCSWCTKLSLPGESLCEKCKEKRISKRAEKKLKKQKIYKSDRRPILFSKELSNHAIFFNTLQLNRSLDCMAPLPKSKYPGTFQLEVNCVPSEYCPNEEPLQQPLEFQVSIIGEYSAYSNNSKVTLTLKTQRQIFAPGSHITFSDPLIPGKDYKIKMTFFNQERHLISKDPARTYYAWPSLLRLQQRSISSNNYNDTIEQHSNEKRSQFFLPYYAIELHDKSILGILQCKYGFCNNTNSHKVFHGRDLKKSFPEWFSQYCALKQPKELNDVYKDDSIPIDLGLVSIWIPEQHNGQEKIAGTIHFYNQYSLSEKGKKIKMFNIPQGTDWQDMRNIRGPH